MSRKHYETFAIEVRAQLLSDSDPYVCAELARTFAGVAKSDNSRFESTRFFEACGLDSMGNPPSSLRGIHRVGGCC